MKITNNVGLPQALVDAVTSLRSDYRRGTADFTATELSKPPLMVRLARDHGDEIEVDAVDCLWAVFGQAVHILMDRAAGVNELTETRLSAKFGRWMVSGQLDTYSPLGGIIQDWKVTSAWSMVYDGPQGRKEYSEQLNVLAELVRRNGGEVKELNDILLFRDWAKSKAQQGGTYPQEKAGLIIQPIWTLEECERWILGRCELLQSALDEPDTSKITPCTPGEMWAKPDLFAVMKTGRKSAVKLHESFDEAMKHANSAGDNHHVEKRPGARTRCEDYCDPYLFCPVRMAEQKRIAEEK